MVAEDRRNVVTDDRLRPELRARGAGQGRGQRRVCNPGNAIGRHCTTVADQGWPGGAAISEVAVPVVESPWREVGGSDAVKPAGELASLTPGPENGSDPASPPCGMAALPCPTDGDVPRISATAATSPGSIFLQDAA
jgi:hypothetical protein